MCPRLDLFYQIFTIRIIKYSQTFPMFCALCFPTNSRIPTTVCSWWWKKLHKILVWILPPSQFSPISSRPSSMVSDWTFWPLNAGAATTTTPKQFGKRSRLWGCKRSTDLRIEALCRRHQLCSPQFCSSSVARSSTTRSPRVGQHRWLCHILTGWSMANSDSSSGSTTITMGREQSRWRLAVPVEVNRGQTTSKYFRDRRCH